MCNNPAPFYYDETAAEGEGPSILAAIDPEDNLFFPVVCTYKDASSAKIYLVNADIEAGIQMLQSANFKYTITNGDVDKCYLLRLSATNRGEGDWAEWDEEVVAAYEEDPLVWTFDDSLFGEGDDDWAWLDELLLDLEHLDWSDEDLLAIWGDLMFEDDDWEILDDEDAWDLWFDYDETEEDAASEAA
ncbi:unnamed protein product [Parascedosporium putredinis]|nr:unnamed protein product [Parascedosporium putredinis]CAI7993379.1 unnamed protein product [Parascedosporium putredinis]